MDGDGRADLVTGSGDTGDLFVYLDADLLAADPAPSRSAHPAGGDGGIYVG
jgi:hypothetical protein